MTDNKFVPCLIRIIKSGRFLLDLRLQELGLRSGQDHLLMELDPEGQPITVSRLADRLGVRPSTVSKSIERFADRGLILRGEHKTDQRLTTVRLTDTGKAARNEVQTVWTEFETYLLDGYPDDAEKLRHSTQRLEAILNDRVRRLR
ncbi:MarR family winged helix-turn-helix transcriptional regulator [Fulvimarina manganoxydans]|uniref:MarR family winged helix-turn-helix transcriptional regulator n=1 Tax=Fulvimarina manganoxydans TaxID=937218 RepID=UPI000A016A47